MAKLPGHKDLLRFASKRELDGGTAIAVPGCQTLALPDQPQSARGWRHLGTSVGLLHGSAHPGVCQRRCAEFAEWQPDVSTNLEAVLNQTDEKRD